MLLWLWGWYASPYPQPHNPKYLVLWDCLWGYGGVYGNAYHSHNQRQIFNLLVALVMGKPPLLTAPLGLLLTPLIHRSLTALNIDPSLLSDLSFGKKGKKGRKKQCPGEDLSVKRCQRRRFVSLTGLTAGQVCLRPDASFGRKDASQGENL